jgi:hypothetical protein
MDGGVEEWIGRLTFSTGGRETAKEGDTSNVLGMNVVVRSIVKDIVDFFFRVFFLMPTRLGRSARLGTERCFWCREWYILYWSRNTFIEIAGRPVENSAEIEKNQQSRRPLSYISIRLLNCTRLVRP